MLPLMCWQREYAPVLWSASDTEAGCPTEALHCCSGWRWGRTTQQHVENGYIRMLQLICLIMVCLYQALQRRQQSLPHLARMRLTAPPGNARTQPQSSTHCRHLAWVHSVILKRLPRLRMQLR